MNVHLRYYIITALACLFFLFCMGHTPFTDYTATVGHMGQNPQSYLIEKARDHRLVLIGTRHKNTQTHALICQVLPILARDSGVNTLFLEIPSNQQPMIDLYVHGSSAVENIGVWSIIASPSYFDIIRTARDLNLRIIAIDNNENVKISRDEWMAGRISAYCSSHLDVRGIIIVGVRHVFKDVEWMFCDAPSLADYLSSRETFSVVIWPEAINSPEPIALDVRSPVFQGLKDPTLEVMNTLPYVSLAHVADGVIFMPSSEENGLGADSSRSTVTTWR